MELTTRNFQKEMNIGEFCLPLGKSTFAKSVKRSFEKYRLVSSETSILLEHTNIDEAHLDNKARQRPHTVVSEKKRTSICELILERYIYLRNTQKQVKLTNYVGNKSFLEFYLVNNGVCLKLLGSLL